MASGTLPLIVINTENGDSIIDKVTRIPAQLYIKETDGSASATSNITIRGRGNATWTLAKKPYKIKFEEKTPLLDLPANKNFALIAWNFGSGNIEWITSICGMEMARMLGMPWAPNIRPVELLLNGNYEGMYFLTETVKINSSRLDIFEQPDLNEDKETIPYGWLVEFDNYAEDEQIIIQETDKLKLRVTSHTPEKMSEAQRNWLIEEFTSLNEAIYSEGEIDWTERIDVTSAVQYFIIREVMFDTDGYSGSLYMHKDMGYDAKWHFGPMWDIVLNISSKSDYSLNLLPSFAVAHWEKPMMCTEAFQQEFLRVWDDFYPTEFNKLKNFALEVAEYCEAADHCNYARWPELSQYSTAETKAELFWSRISRYAKWLDENKNLKNAVFAGIDTPVANVKSKNAYYDLQGRRVLNPTPGIYIANGRKVLIR